MTSAPNITMAIPGITGGRVPKSTILLLPPSFALIFRQIFPRVAGLHFLYTVESSMHWVATALPASESPSILMS